MHYLKTYFINMQFSHVKYIKLQTYQQILPNCRKAFIQKDSFLQQNTNIRERILRMYVKYTKYTSS